MALQSFASRLRSATPDALAAWIKAATAEEHRQFEAYYGAERYRRVRNAVLRSSELASRSQRASRNAKRGNVVVIPGIMGSELSLSASGGKARVLWMSLVRMFAVGHLPRLALMPDGTSSADATLQFTASGLLRKYYDELEQRLLVDWNVRHFPYDWRRDIGTSAELLGAFLKTEFGEQPVHLVAHSMGGLVARLMLLSRSRGGQAADRLLNGGRLVMLGTPNLGSYETPQILTGIQDTVRQLIKGWGLARPFSRDAEESRRAVLAVVNTFPAVYQLLPKNASALYDPKLYQGLGVEIVSAHFKRAIATHAELAQAVYPALMHYIAGCHPRLPTAVGINDKAPIDSPDGYRWSRAGDGRVSHESGRLPGVTMMYVVGDHGGLTENPAVLDSLDELLANGKAGAALLQTAPDVGQRGDASPPPQRDDAETELWRQLFADPRSVRAQLPMRGKPGAQLQTARPTLAIVDAEQDLAERITAGLLGPDSPRCQRNLRADDTLVGEACAARTTTAELLGELEIEIIVGGIEDAEVLTGKWFPEVPPKWPVDGLAVGQYMGVPRDGAARSLDAAVSEGLGERLDGLDNGVSTTESESTHIFFQAAARGLFRGYLGEMFLVEDVRKAGGDLFRTAAVVGMGPSSEFGAPELTVLARQLAWTFGFIGRRHLATVVMGGRRGGLPPEVAILAWLRGFARAISEMSGEAHRRRRLRKVTFVEHKIERAFQFEAALRRMVQFAGARMSETASEIQFPLDGVDFKFRFWPKNYVERKKADFSKRCEKECADRGAKLGEPGANAAASSVVRMTVESEAKRGQYRFSLLTPDASIPERDVEIDYRLIDDAIHRLVAENIEGEQLAYGEVLSRLLTPKDFRNFLQASGPLTLALDARTARIPWELLTTFNGRLDQERANVDRFLSLGRCLTRQFRSVFAPVPEPLPDASRDVNVLVVADPAAHAPLAGAQEEALLLADLFTAFNRTRLPGQGQVRYKVLAGPWEAQRLDVLRQVMLNQYDVLHFCGHCFFDKVAPERSGWIFGIDSNGAEELLAATELDRLDRVPRMIFSNACESGVTPDRPELRSAGMAPSFAEAFFKQGVRNFLCSGWPVNDRVARDFSVDVYAGMLGMLGRDVRISPRSGGTNFTENPAAHFLTLSQALLRARRNAAGNSHGRQTWGAYQHYGDPDFRFFPDEPLVPGA